MNTEILLKLILRLKKVGGPFYLTTRYLLQKEEWASFSLFTQSLHLESSQSPLIPRSILLFKEVSIINPAFDRFSVLCL